MNRQERARANCKFLKWSKEIDYKEMAKAIGMSENSFYNFISGRKANLGYSRIVKLEKYIKENL